MLIHVHLFNEEHDFVPRPICTLLLLLNIWVFTVTGNNKRMRMFEVPEKMRSLIIDQKIVISNEYVSIYTLFFP
jgi:hypothetical protein